MFTCFVIVDDSDNSPLGYVVASPILQMRKLNCSSGHIEEGVTPSITTDNVAKT